MEYITGQKFNGETILMQHKFETELYIITREEGRYKAFVISESYPEGKKIRDSRNGSEVIGVVPHG